MRRTVLGWVGFIVLIATPVFAAPAAAAGDSWIGQRVMLKKHETRFVLADESGRAMDVELNDMKDYRVEDDKGDRIQVHYHGESGWLAKGDAVLLDDAADYYTDRIRADAHDDWAFAHRGRARREKGDLDAALKDLDEAVRLNPKAVWVCQRGLIWYSKKEYEKAMADFDQAIRLDPTYPASLIDRGLVHRVNKEYDQAIADFDEAIRLDPKEAVAFTDRGIVYAAEKEYDKAIADFDEAIRLDPQHAADFTNRGHVYLIEKEYESAVADFDEAIRLDPKDVAAFGNRGDLYWATREHAKALADYEETVRLNPASPAGHAAVAWVLATCPDEKLRDGKRAVEEARKACELSQWKNAHCLEGLAAACAEVGDFDDAVHWENKALEYPDYEAMHGVWARRRLHLYENNEAYREK